MCVCVWTNVITSYMISLITFTLLQVYPFCLSLSPFLSLSLPFSFYRYNISSHPVEFVTDNNVSTYWVSEESPVLVSLGLANITSLSKIFVNFRDSSPAGLRLQYLKEPTRVWTDLQYYASNCSASFGVAAGNRY